MPSANVNVNVIASVKAGVNVKPLLVPIFALGQAYKQLRTSLVSSSSSSSSNSNSNSGSCSSISITEEFFLQTIAESRFGLCGGVGAV